MSATTLSTRPGQMRSAIAPRRALAAVLAVAAVLVLWQGPELFDRGQLDEAVTLFGLIAIAQGWNILAGLGGQVSLGVGAFAGTGGYTAALLMLHADVSLMPATALAAVAGALLAAIVSPAVFRLRGPYFTVGTLGLALAIQAWMQNWSYSGGTQPLSLPFDQVPAQDRLYRMALVIAVLAVLVAVLIRRSAFGLRLMAVRDNEPAASSLGVPVLRVKSAVFAISGAIVAVAGALVAAQSASIEPGSAFGLGYTVDAVVMTVIGGIGTIVGPIVGVLVVFYAIEQQLADSPDISLLVTGALLIAIVRFAPEGVWPRACRVAGAAYERIRDHRAMRRKARP